MEIILKDIPVFVIGTGRCGTTLLTDLIQGDRISCLKERQVLSRFREFGNQHIFNLLYRGDITEQVFLKYYKAVRIEIIKKHQTDKIYCEKIPHGQWAIKSIKKVFPQAKFIEIYREGKDTVQSMLNAEWYATNDTRPRWLPYGDLNEWTAMSQFEKSCTRLAHTIRFTIDNILTLSSNDYLYISYEELMAEPEAMLKQMEDFTRTKFYRGRVTLRPSLHNWKKWTKEEIETYYQTLGQTGIRDQEFLGYGQTNTADGGVPYSLQRRKKGQNRVQNESGKSISNKADVNIFMLVKDRKEFTDIALKYLYKFTDFSMVNRLVFVNDCSKDGADEICRFWTKKTGMGEVVNVKGGTVTNALFNGTQQYLNDQVRYMVKLDNDLILSEDWLKKIYIKAESQYFEYDVFGFTTVNEFFPSTPDEIWKQRAPESYLLTAVPYSGENFLMKWNFFKRFRHVGITQNPVHYISGSLSEVHRMMSRSGLLRIALINPHLPVFKLDKVADKKYDKYKFFEKRRISRESIKELIEKYYLNRMCRKRLVNGEIKNIHTIQGKGEPLPNIGDKYPQQNESIVNEHSILSVDDAKRNKPYDGGRKIICIAGMHRSGTSMISRLLMLCGLYTGSSSKIIPPKPDNAAGFWENIDFVKLNDQILAHLGGGWDFIPLSVKEGWEHEVNLDPMKKNAVEFTKTFANKELWGWKDPRNSLTLPFWRSIFPEIRVVICIRNPLEVALSLQKRNNSSIPFGLSLWQIYNHRLMLDTKPEERVVTHYEAYFANPEKELRRISDLLGLSVSEGKINKACSSIVPSLRHNRFSKKDILRAGASPQLLRIYEDFCSEAGPIFQKTLRNKISTAAPHQAELLLTSVIILTHNQLKYTKMCIKSIFEHTKKPFELIVVDNGSTDGTVKYLEKLSSIYSVGDRKDKKEITQRRGKKRKKKVKEVELLKKTCRCVNIILNNQNKGFAAGNNQGINVARGDYILLMNNDVVVTSGWLNRMISCAEKSPDIGMVGPISNYVSGLQLVDDVKYNTASLAGLSKFAAKRAGKYSGRSRRILRVVGFCMLIKRAVVDKIGGLDSRYGLGNFEDDDFSLRAALAGFGSCIAEDCFIHHFGNRTFIGAKIDYRDSLYKNWEIFKEKWGLPKELSYGSPYNVMQISKSGFVPEKHFCPLTGMDSQLKNECGNTSFDSNSNAAEKIYINEIQPLINERKNEKATIALEELIKLYPKYALAYNDLGVLYFNKDEKEKALSHYEKAVQLQPENITYQKNLADFYYVVLGRVEEAMQIYVKVLNTNPEDIEILLIIGHICISMEKFDDAKVFYSHVLKIEPQNEDARKFLEKLEKCQMVVPDSQLDLETGSVEHSNREKQREENNKIFKMYSESHSSDNIIHRIETDLSQASVRKIDEHRESKLKALNSDIQVSIIIPTSGQQKYVKNCVDSIRKHTKGKYEIVLTNNGATKGTEKWLKKNINENLNYHMVKCPKDKGSARIINEGIKASTGEYILLLSNDVVVTKGWLEGILECLQSIPDVGIVGPMSNVSSGTQRVLTADNISTEKINEFAESFMNKNRNRRIPAFSIDGFCMLFSRNLVEEVGFFDEQFGLNGYENEDFCLRALLEGRKNFIAGDVYIHQQNKKAFSPNKKYFNAKWNKADAQSSSGKKFLTLTAIEKGCSVYQRGYINNAVEILLEGIGLSPDDKHPYYALAEILLHAKNHKDAIDILNEMPQDEQDVKRLELLGYCKEGMDNNKEAQDYTDRILSINGNYAQALNLKGILAFKQGRISSAEDCFNKAIESDPGYGEPYTNLGAILWDSQPGEALVLFEKGFILSPTITDIITNYHSAITASGEFGRAAQVFEEASLLYPNNKMIKYQLIDLLIKQEKNAEAMNQIEEASALYGVDDGVLAAALKIRDMLGPIEIDETKDKKYTVSLCMIVKNEEEYLARCLKSVKPVVDEMIVIDTGSNDRTIEIARAFGAKVYNFKWTGDFSEARNFSLSKASGNWTFHLDADEVISSLDYEAFRKVIRQSATKKVALLINTRNYTMDVNQVGWTENDGHYEKEESATGWTPSEKVRLFRNESDIRFEYPIHELVEPSLKTAGITVKESSIPVHHYGKLNKEKSSKKVEVYYQIGRKKLDETGGDAVAIRELAIQAEIIKKHDEAIELWERFIAIEPNVPKAYINMGISYCSLGKYKEVIETAKKAMKLEPDLKEAHYNYALGKLHLGSAGEAVSILEKLLKRLGEYPPAQFLLAAAYICGGEKDKGINELKELQKSSIGPGLPIRCHELAKGLVSSHRHDYAIMLLEAAIDSKNSNKDVLELYSNCLEMMNVDRKTGTMGGL